MKIYNVLYQTNAQRKDGAIVFFENKIIATFSTFEKALNYLRAFHNAGNETVKYKYEQLSITENKVGDNSAKAVKCYAHDGEEYVDILKVCPCVVDDETSDPMKDIQSIFG